MGLLSWLPGRPARPTVRTTLLFGDLRTGRITDTLDATTCNWTQVNNDAGAVDQVVVPEREVRRKDLRRTARAARTFLAVDIDGRIQQFGPIWSRTWDDERQQLTLGAAGLWSLFDHRKVLPVLAAGQRVQDAVTTVSGTDLGGIGQYLVAQAMAHVGGNLPVILPELRAGDRTETFYGWELLDVGDQIRQLTKRETAAPDIRFRPRYTADRLGIEAVMETGTEDTPLLTQIGDDWYFDTTVPKSPVLNISTDEDATVMGQRAWVTGSGQEQDVRIGTAYDPTQVNDGYPLLEVEEMRSNVIEQATLDGHAENLRDRSARPIEIWKVTVRAEAAVEVLAGDYARVIVPADHAWLPAGEAFMRIKTKSGDLGDTVTLDMYPVAGTV